MQSSTFSVSLELSLIILISSVACCNFQEKCLSFSPERYVYNSTRTVLSFVAAGTNLAFPDNDPTCTRPNQTVAVNLCRIGLSIPTSNRSSISFELWMPENWSSRFLATGNGGIDGCKSRSETRSIRCCLVSNVTRYQVRRSRIHRPKRLCDCRIK